MTERELRRLNRRKLLQMLLAQADGVEKLHERLDASQEQTRELEADLVQLKSGLNERDAQIERIKSGLDRKDEQIRRLQELEKRCRESRRVELDETGDLAAEARQLIRIFEEAQRTAEQYLRDARLQRGGEPSERGMQAKGDGIDIDE